MIFIKEKRVSPFSHFDYPSPSDYFWAGLLWTEYLCPHRSVHGFLVCKLGTTIPTSQGYCQDEAKQFQYAQNMVRVHWMFPHFSPLHSQAPTLVKQNPPCITQEAPGTHSCKPWRKEILPCVLMGRAGLWLGWCHSCASGCFLVKRHFSVLKNSQGGLFPVHGKEDIFCPSSKSSLHRLLSRPSTLFIKMPTYSLFGE